MCKAGYQQAAERYRWFRERAAFGVSKPGDQRGVERWAAVAWCYARKVESELANQTVRYRHPRPANRIALGSPSVLRTAGAASA